MRRKLNATLAAITLLVGLIYISLRFFAPQLGFLFGLISTNRNEEGPKDTIVPPPPIFSNIPSATSKTGINISGIAEPGSTVTLFVNGPKAGESIADSEGGFAFMAVNLRKGKNLIYAKSKDSSGNESGKSATAAVTVDEEKPTITIDAPKDGEMIRNLNERIEVKGRINEEAVVKINGRLAVSRPSFEFELLIGVDEGRIEIKIEAVDKAGNKAEKLMTVTYEKQG